nr:zinc finger ccch domain-containing protein zfn-like [Quercus suber]
MGLPLRLGEALCIFYSCYGFCKFGPSCKFEHLIDISKYLSLSSSGTAALSLSSEELDDAGKVDTGDPRGIVSLPTCGFCDQSSPGRHNIQRHYDLKSYKHVDSNTWDLMHTFSMQKDLLMELSMLARLPRLTCDLE